MTSATERLRALLDERGVEWEPSVWDAQHETFYSVENGVGFIVTEFPEIGRMSLACDMRITPAQAIDATLGRGTCRDVRSEDATIAFECSECGCWVAYDEYWETGIYIQGEGQQVHIHPHYCPNCGRRVVE